MASYLGLGLRHRLCETSGGSKSLVNRCSRLHPGAHDTQQVQHAWKIAIVRPIGTYAAVPGQIYTTGKTVHKTVGMTRQSRGGLAGGDFLGISTSVTTRSPMCCCNSKCAYQTPVMGEISTARAMFDLWLWDPHEFCYHIQMHHSRASIYNFPWRTLSSSSFFRRAP